jgi:hypothetical protein
VRYEEIADRVLVQMSDSERTFLERVLEEPSEDYKLLVLQLEQEGCEFPRQQAALMMRNSPGVARQLIAQRRAEGAVEA